MGGPGGSACRRRRLPGRPACPLHPRGDFIAAPPRSKHAGGGPLRAGGFEVTTCRSRSTGALERARAGPRPGDPPLRSSARGCATGGPGRALGPCASRARDQARECRGDVLIVVPAPGRDRTGPVVRTERGRSRWWWMKRDALPDDDGCCSGGVRWPGRSTWTIEIEFTEDEDKTQADAVLSGTSTAVRGRAA